MNSLLDKLDEAVAAHERAEAAVVEIDALNRTPRTTAEAEKAAERLVGELFPNYPMRAAQFMRYARQPLGLNEKVAMPPAIARAVFCLYKAGAEGKAPSDWTEALHWAVLYWPEHQRLLLDAIEKNTDFVAEAALGRAVEFIRPQKEEFIGSGFEAKEFSLEELDGCPDHPPELVPRLFYKGEVHALPGISAGGKTTVAIRLMIDVALGRPALGVFQAVAPGKVMFVSAEDRADATLPRIKKMIGDDTEAKVKFLANFRFIDLTRTSSVLHARNQENRDLLVGNALLKSLEKKFIDEAPVLVVIDPMVAFYAGNENDNNQAATFMKDLRAMAERCSAAVLLIHHISKADGRNEDLTQFAARGASAFVSNCRRAYQIAGIRQRSFQYLGRTWVVPREVGDEQFQTGNVMLFIEHKDSYQRLWDAPLALLRTNGFTLTAFRCETETPEARQAELSFAVEAAVVEFTRRQLSLGIEVTKTTLKNSSREMQGRPGKDAVANAYDRLLARNALVTEARTGVPGGGRRVVDINQTALEAGEPF